LADIHLPVEESGIRGWPWLDLAYFANTFALLCVEKISKRKGRQGFRRGTRSWRCT